MAAREHEYAGSRHMRTRLEICGYRLFPVALKTLIARTTNSFFWHTHHRIQNEEMPVQLASPDLPCMIKS
jgi:hypothetical protein